MTEVQLVPLESNDREQFIKDNSFDEFLNMLLDKDDGAYSVSDIIDRFEEGDIKANI